MSDPPAVSALTAALTAAFARHEQDVPVAAALRPAIAAGVRKRRTRRRWMLSGVTALVLALAGSLPLALPDRPMPPVHTESLLGVGSPDVGNFLLLGTDRRPESPGETVRADAILLLHVDADTRTVFQLSIPRDLLLEVPNFGTQQVGTAFVFGGYELTSRLVGNLLGVQIDGGAVIDFTAMQRITEAVGGVELCVEQQTISIHLGYDPSTGHVVPLRSGMQPVIYEPGCRHFAGWQALDYVRQRQSLAQGGDDRDAHVRQLLAALARQLGDPVKLAKAMPVAGSALDLHLGDVSLPMLAGMLAGFDTAAVPGLKLPMGQDRTVLPDGDGLLTALRNGTVPAWALAHPQYVG
ncbi:LCP family protein [Dactylosporangium sp. NPDC049525]|uniref:LCP family protein n=1 Tax=Dactylosporangium sp. NPDC049525 TaxID=3154730 RepID=UPI0034343BB2